MSKPYNGKDMDRPYQTPGSVNRAQQQAHGMLGRETQAKGGPSIKTASPANTGGSSGLAQIQPESQSNLVKNRGTPSHEPISGQPISRPRQVPQWPLTGSIIPSPVRTDSYLPSQSHPRPDQIPQRPPRPSQSRIPSILNRSRPQQPTPVFASRPTAPASSECTTTKSHNVFSPSESSARQTMTSVGAMPALPVASAPVSTAAIPRKSATLGPPPSSRRGTSSFYPCGSLVSPIPEESPRVRSPGSSASIAAVPGAWAGMPSQAHSPVQEETLYEESITEKSRDSTCDEYGDESQLVRSASLGKKHKPALITAISASQGAPTAKSESQPMQTKANDESYRGVRKGSSETIPALKNQQSSVKHNANADSISSDAILKAFAAASSSDVKESIPLADTSRQNGRTSTLRRPPRLDIDAVRDAEARGSLTSLPDLILRATKLASMIDKGKRPASRVDTFDGYLHEKDDRYQSGFSDMLAAFPPPVHTSSNTASRSSWLRSSTWAAAQGQDRPTHSRTQSGQAVIKVQRRCCGLPIWGFVLLIFLLLCLIVAAIVVPLEFFVFKKIGNNGKQNLSLALCQQSLTCRNGGSNIIAQGSCSCICTNGFTGSTCGDSVATGCSFTNLVSTDGQSNIQNVTLGQAIPRLLADSNQNFSVPLAGTTILAKFNAGNLSCVAQNSLVTFDGRSTRSGQPTDVVDDVPQNQVDFLLKAEQFPPISIITFTPTTTTATSDGQAPSQLSATSISVVPIKTAAAGISFTSEIKPTSAPTSTVRDITLPTTLVIDTSSATITNANPAASGFVVTEEKVDFARVAVLYILQEKGVDKAISAQAELQRVFSKITTSKLQPGSGVSTSQAANVIVGSGNSIDLVDFTINIGKGPVGRGKVKRQLLMPHAG